MTTTTFTANVFGSNARAIVLRMSPTPPLCLTQIMIALGAAGTPINGSCTPGDGRHSASRSITVNPLDFARLSKECPAPSNVVVTMTYDSAFNVTAIDCGTAVHNQAEVPLQQVNEQLG